MQAQWFYTSGTTGTTGSPKGVLTTHDALLSNAETMIRRLGVAKDVGAGLRTLISVRCSTSRGATRSC